MGWLLLAGGVHLVFLLLQELSNLRMEEADAARTVCEMSVVKEDRFLKYNHSRPGQHAWKPSWARLVPGPPAPTHPHKHEQNQASVTLTNLK